MESKKTQNMKEYMKEYNKKYYSDNKDKILDTLAKKEICEFCGREVTHQHMVTHQKTKLCTKRRNQSDDITNLIKQIETLTAKLKATK